MRGGSCQLPRDPISTECHSNEIDICACSGSAFCASLDLMFPCSFWFFFPLPRDSSPEILQGPHPLFSHLAFPWVPSSSFPSCVSPTGFAGWRRIQVSAQEWPWSDSDTSLGWQISLPGSTGCEGPVLPPVIPEEMGRCWRGGNGAREGAGKS